MDEEGYVTIVDRAKDMINVGGEKVYPRDVEEVLHKHPAIADAVVVGIPDPDLGEVVKTLVALNPGKSLTSDELIAYLRPHLARFKLPRVVEFVDAVPQRLGQGAAAASPLTPRPGIKPFLNEEPRGPPEPPGRVAHSPWAPGSSNGAAARSIHRIARQNCYPVAAPCWSRAGRRCIHLWQPAR